MITDIRLQNFRSYTDASFELNPGVNIVVGPNASGKTNLLEAILVLARGSSYRVGDEDLIQFEKPWARLDVHINTGGTRTVKIERGTTITKTYEIEGKAYKRLTLNHSLPVVLFEPNHLQLLSGGPERRRTYLDDLLEQTEPGYGTIRRQYQRALSQRNSLLKQPGAIHTQLFPWDVRLSQLGGQIVRQRSKLAEKIDKETRKLYKELSQTKTKLNLTYKSQWSPDAYESSLLKKLAINMDIDRQRGFTTTGPHRDDLEALIDGHAAQDAASRGEARTIILALKVTELKLIEAARETTPLLLLDDVFSELDGKRRHALTDYLKKYQTFITTTDADAVVGHFTENTNIIPLI